MSKTIIYQPFTPSQVKELEKINAMTSGSAKNSAIDAIAKACNKKRAVITTKLWYMTNAKTRKVNAMSAERTIELPIKGISVKDNKVIITY